MMFRHPSKPFGSKRTQPHAGKYRTGRRQGIEPQSGRCPRCNRVMSLCYGGSGLTYLCGCR